MLVNSKMVGAVICALIGITIGCTPASEAPPPATPPVAPPAITPHQAQAGDGIRGQSLRDNQGVAKIASAPASAFFNVEQKMVLEVQIPQALQLFKASEGRFPKSHDEFMQKIVQANQLKLPELPAGAMYRFEPDKGELWVFPSDAAANTP